MTESKADQDAVSARAARPSLIQSFGIRGLYGYRSISLNSDYSAAILIARNGSGKTTLLGALNAFLRLQFSRLRNLEFGEIHCKLRPIDDELVLTHEEVIEFLQVPAEGELSRAASRANIQPGLLFTFIIEEWSKEFGNSRDATDNKVYSAILNANNYNYRETFLLCDRLKKSLYERETNINRIATAINTALEGYDIVYLPTYRRIELALTDDNKASPDERRRRLNRLRKKPETNAGHAISRPYGHSVSNSITSMSAVADRYCAPLLFSAAC